MPPHSASFLFLAVCIFGLMAIEARVAQGTRRKQVIATRERRVPLRRKMGTAWDVDNAALFLHSDEASYITGVSLMVDGGMSIDIPA